MVGNKQNMASRAVAVETFSGVKVWSETPTSYLALLNHLADLKGVPRAHVQLFCPESEMQIWSDAELAACPLPVLLLLSLQPVVPKPHTKTFLDLDVDVEQFVTHGSTLGPLRGAPLFPFRFVNPELAGKIGVPRIGTVLHRVTASHPFDVELYRDAPRFESKQVGEDWVCDLCDHGVFIVAWNQMHVIFQDKASPHVDFLYQDLQGHVDLEDKCSVNTAQRLAVYYLGSCYHVKRLEEK